MADPRAVVLLTDAIGPYVGAIYDNSTILYDATKERGSPSVDLAVMLSADNTVALCADGDAIYGKLVSVDNDTFCTVRTSGYVTLPGGNAATLTRGATIVGALGAAAAKGYVRSAASATAAELVKARGRIVDASDPTAVVIQL